MIKKYAQLTADQEARCVVFSSQLICKGVEDDITHEVFAYDDNIKAKMQLLTDDLFFDESHYDYNLIRD